MLARFLEWTSQNALISSRLGGDWGKLWIISYIVYWFCESEYYSYNDWADFLGMMELAAAAVTLLHWAWIIHETITLLLSVAECKATWHMHKGQGSIKIIVLSDKSPNCDLLYT